MIDNTLKNPYDMTIYGVDRVKVMNSKKDNELRRSLSNYRFDFLLSGDNINKELLLVAAYLGPNGSESSFTLDEDDIDDLIIKLTNARERIKRGKEAKGKLEEIHNELEKYLKAGYVDHIVMERKDVLMPPYYNKAYYMAFKIMPHFRTDIEIPDEVNTGFCFLEVLHLDIDEAQYGKTMDYVRHYYDIPVTVIGFDREAEIQKRYKEALKDADKRIKDMKESKKEDRDKEYRRLLHEVAGIPTNVMSSKALNEQMKAFSTRKK